MQYSLQNKHDYLHQDMEILTASLVMLKNNTEHVDLSSVVSNVLVTNADRRWSLFVKLVLPFQPSHLNVKALISKLII